MKIKQWWKRLFKRKVKLSREGSVILARSEFNKAAEMHVQWSSHIDFERGGQSPATILRICEKASQDITAKLIEEGCVFPIEFVGTVDGEQINITVGD